jgi:site-specific recombinase XerD
MAKTSKKSKIAAPSKSARRTLPAGKTLTFSEILRSFIGFLEANEKSRSTIVSYRGDLRTFEAFLEHGMGKRRVAVQELNPKDLDRYQDYLVAEGFKNNTQRRKLLVLRKLLKWLHRRNKLGSEIGVRLPTLKRIERIPFTVDTRELLSAIRKLPAASELDARNRALLWLLAESGCQVSEVKLLKFEQVRVRGKEAWIDFGGRNGRSVPVSRDWADWVREIKKIQKSKDNPWIFMGYNRFGPLKGPISSRGVELLVRGYAAKLGEKRLVPRTFRHSVVIHWARQGLDSPQIQKLLGLRSQYAFRLYEPMLRAKLG